MGRFEAKSVKIRKLSWGDIVFRDGYCIEVITPDTTVIFHRYYAQKGNYSGSWADFRRELMRRKLETVYDVYKYADKFEITHNAKLNLKRGKK